MKINIKNLYAVPCALVGILLYLSGAAAEISLPPGAGTKAAFSCKGKLDTTATLILIDATDRLSEGQVAFVTDNFINNIEWESENEAFTIVALHDDPLAKMYSTTFCSPKHESKIDPVLDNPAKIRLANENFRGAISKTFEKLVDDFSKRKEAESTLLIEAIAEINRNARYRFNHAKKKNLIIISDLYQKSNIISFFRMCKSVNAFSSRPLTCPGFEETVKKNARFANYMQKAVPKMTDTDIVKIYYLNMDGRVDRSAEKWWLEYFSRTGLPNVNLSIIPELQTR